MPRLNPVVVGCNWPACQYLLISAVLRVSCCDVMHIVAVCLRRNKVDSSSSYYYYYEHISPLIDDSLLIQYRALLCFLSEQEDFLYIVTLYHSS